MQGGRLKPDEKQAAKPRGGQARWRFADGRALLLTEAGTERKAGVWVVADDPDGQPPLDDLGPEADGLDEPTLAKLLGERSMRLHGWLRDQRILAGVGRRLANEVCHRARLSPFASTGKLDAEQVGRLHAALGACIAESLAYERTRDDMSSSKERPGAVHHREGETCPVCGDTVRAVEYARYTVNYCPTCQTGGKVLADNTTSKFLK
jgi:formamidopyrimidine-DNA glycosylase